MKTEECRTKGKTRRRRISPEDTEKNEQLILWISFGAGVAFAIAEFISAALLHSQSVLMDAAYDSSELIVIILTLFLTPLFHKPISEKRPYGFMQVESIFIIIKSFMLLSVTVGLVGNSLNVALDGGNQVDGGEIALLQLILGAISMVVYYIMAKLNRSLSSPTVKAELLGWKIDILYSMGLAAAFFASIFLDRTPLAFLSPYFDQIVAILIVVFMLPENLEMLWRAIQDVFLFSPEESIVDHIKETCDPCLKRFEFDPVFYDITRTGRQLWTSVYFQIGEDQLSLRKLRAATASVQEAVSAELENCTVELILVADEEDTPLKCQFN